MTLTRISSLSPIALTLSLLVGACTTVDGPTMGSGDDPDDTTGTTEQTQPSTGDDPDDTTGEDPDEPTASTTTAATDDQPVPLGCEDVEPGPLAFETSHGVFMSAADFQDQELLASQAGGPLPPEAEVLILTSHAEFSCAQTFDLDDLWCHPDGNAQWYVLVFPAGLSEGTFTQDDLHHFGVTYLGGDDCDGGGGDISFNELELELTSASDRCVTGMWNGFAFWAGDTTSSECE